MYTKHAIKSFLYWVCWISNAGRLIIPKSHKHQYKIIFYRTLEKLGKPPNLIKGNDFNNKIKWLMLFDQRPEIITLTDKLAVRDFVCDRLGKHYLNKLYGVWDDPGEIDLTTLPESFVIKTNHDSGSVWIIHNKSDLDLDLLKSEVNKKIKRVYGASKGEWQYQFIKPKIFAERLLKTTTCSVADYKFHCCNGEVIFCQYIYERTKNHAKEIILEPDGTPTSLLLYEKFSRGTEFSKPEKWDEMLKASELLSKGFKYVRIDLYDSEYGILFGEMTFYPANGNYKTSGQNTLGEKIIFDRKIKLPIHTKTNLDHQKDHS